MKKWQEILGWIKVKLIKPRMTKEPKTQRGCGIYRTTKQYIFLTGYGKTGIGYSMSYPIKFAPIDCDDVDSIMLLEKFLFPGIATNTRS